MRRALLSSIFSVFIVTGCTVKDEGGGSGRRSPTAQGPAETTACATSTTYSGGATVTGTAQYVRRVVKLGVSNEGLGSADPNYTDSTRRPETRPIRAAEVRVLDAAGSVVQCAQTSPTDGTFSFTLPNTNADYTVYVNSRSFRFNGGNTYLQASVLNRPEENKFYSITATVNPSVSTSIGTMTAEAYSSGALLGGAFNILDMLFEANDYLRQKTGQTGSLCSSSFAGCRDVTLANPVPKVSAYWEKGFNPNEYFGSGSGLSFYLPGYARLFILGGVSGDVDSSDTDHFDNSVIVHEYGHFLEDSLSQSDSPGGSHNGNKVIDPRLAWSEGWGNFFQAAVLNPASETAPKYIDTAGNIDGDPGVYFEVNLEDETSLDIVRNPGEGNFREFSVTRLLWDIVDSVSDTSITRAATDNVSNHFSEIWAIFTRNSHGYNDPTYAFRNVGLVHYSQSNYTDTGSTSWAGPRGLNWHDGDTSHYAQYVTAGSCSANTISPNVSTTGNNPTSNNYFLHHRFFHFKPSSTGTYTFRLSYQTTTGSVEADLDLVVYAEDHALGSTSGLLGSADASPDNNLGNGETETVSVGLTANRNYLIDVSAYTGTFNGVNYKNAGATDFSISVNGSTLCPANL
jgi:hypothetical protein